MSTSLASSETRIVGLRCAGLHSPLGLGESQPTLSWRWEGSRRGLRQTAYRVRVSSSHKKLCTDEGDLWDSGRIEGDEQLVTFGGAPLGSRDGAFWVVEAWDEGGTLFRSEPAYWEMGLLERSDWNAEWIGGTLRGGKHTSSPCPYLRHAFALDQPIDSARLYATALGVYECEINGQKVSDQLLAPGWTDYHARVHYQTYDVTELLREGDNVWGAVIGDGWGSGHVGWWGRQQYHEAPCFLAQLEIVFEDGTRQTIASDGTWKTGYGPILESDMVMGESYDARQEQSGWSTPDFDDARWLPVELTPDAGVALSAPLGPPVRATQELHPIAEPRREGGAWIFDMGQNMVGRVRLKVQEPRGKTIRLRFAEVLAGGPAATTGPIYITNLRTARQTDYYTCKGEGEETHEPRFTFHGFRYVEVVGLTETPTRDTITGVVIHSDTPQTGDFTCSDPLVNQLQRNIDWGQRGNFVDIPTDCPQRDERLGWMGDAQVFVRTAAYNRDVATFFREWSRDIRDAQFPDGAVPCVVPNIERAATVKEPWHDGGPAWADAVLICPWTIYQCYGDRRILEENYDTFTRFMEYQHNTSQEGLRCSPDCGYWPGFGDWLALDGSGITEGGTPRELIGTAFYAHGADLMRQIATVLDKPSEALRYEAMFQTARAAFNRRFVTEGGLVFPGTQTAYVLALHFNLLPEELREQAALELVREIKRRGDKLSTGFVGSPYLPHVLTQTGHLDAAYTLLHQTGWPSYLYAVTQNATTIWERWDGWTAEKGFQDVGMNSFNHYAYGAVGDWLFGCVAGIDLAAPGYARLRMAPRPDGKLTDAHAHLDTPRGRAESAWQLSEGEFHWNVQVPPNTRAELRVPTSDASAPIREGSSDAEASQGLTLVRREADCVVFEAAAGRYELVATYVIPGA